MLTGAMAWALSGTAEVQFDTMAIMFMTLLTNGLWMLFLLIVCILFFAGTDAYRSELESIDVPDAD